MDPDETLAALRGLVKDWHKGTAAEAEAHAEAIADTFAALDEWLTRGGFLPAEWQHS